MKSAGINVNFARRIGESIRHESQGLDNGTHQKVLCFLSFKKGVSHIEIKFMEIAVKLAQENVISGCGGPFGAVIVKNGEIVGTGCNQVTATNDPTAHAEVQAIRNACQNLNSFQLNDCEVYTSCEPCPMCFGALYWARPKAIYYACTKEDAAKIGFDDNFIYEELKKPLVSRSIRMLQLQSLNYDLPFITWTSFTNKVEY